MRNRHESLLHEAATGRRDRAFARTARAAARRDGTAPRWWRRRRPEPAPVPAAALTYARVVQQWDEVTAGQSDDLRETVGWDRDVPAGMRVHVASSTDGGLRTTDVWDSEELFTAYQQQRVLPGLERLGIRARPEVAVSSVFEFTDRVPAPRRPAD